MSNLSHTSSDPNGSQTRKSGLPDAPPARIGQALGLSIRETWDKLGTLIGISLTWAALLAVPLLVGQILPLPVPARYAVMLIVASLTLSAPVAGACYVAHLICSHDEVAYTDFWRGAARFAGPATRLGLIHLAALSIITVNVWFYLRLGHLTGFIAALLFGYLLLFWLMMGVYHYPLLVAQETGSFDEPDRKARRGVLAVLRRAFFLALGSPRYTLGLLLFALVLSLLCAAITFLLPLIWLGALSVLTTQALRLLLIQYGVLPPPPAEDEIIPDEKFRIQDRINTGQN